MAWVATDDFNSYSDGDLNGNNGGSGFSAAWSGSVNFDVQGTTVAEGAKAIVNTSGSNISRALTSAVSGDGNIVYFAMRNSSAAAGGAKMRFLDGSSAIREQIIMNSSGNIVLGITSPVTVLAGYSANTWYFFKLTLNVTSQTATLAYSTDAYGTAGSFSAESSSHDFSSDGTGNIANIQLDADTGSTKYWDYISDTSPYPVEDNAIFFGCNF